MPKRVSGSSRRLRKTNSRVLRPATSGLSISTVRFQMGQATPQSWCSKQSLCQTTPYPTRQFPRNNAPLNLPRSHEKPWRGTGFSLKEIGDHLGHRSAYATRTYAKVDLVGLSAVANF